MSLRRQVTTAAAACLSSHSAFAQTRLAAPNPIGVWRGTSHCVVRPSSCNDETVVYRITRVSSADSVSVDARKIVNGREEEMGVLGCRLAASDAQLHCTMPNGAWRFTIRGDSMLGVLWLRDSTKYRDVRAARAPAAQIDRK